MGFFDDRTVVITGGTGSLGRALTRRLLESGVKAVRALSRDEYKGHVWLQQFPDPRAKFIMGDVRDLGRLRMAFYGADVVINAAAVKRIERAAADPLEAVKTNVNGTSNVIEAALDCGVERVMGISTDKACRPVTHYGITKACAESLLINANIYHGDRKTRFAACRYGNVAGSRGSLIPMLLDHDRSKPFPVTSRGMTRFWMRMDQAVDFVLSGIEQMAGGEVFIPKLPSVWVGDVIEAVVPGAETEVVGLRGIEKMHEDLVALDESANTQELPDRYIVRTPVVGQAPRLSYDSGTNPWFLSVEEIAAQVPVALREAA